MSRPHWSALVPVLLTFALPAAGQETSINPKRGGVRSLMPRAREIALARSAAPKAVSTEATVLVLTDTGFAVAESGGNGVTCIVDRSWPTSLEPHCYDKEGSETILKIRLREAALRQRGKSEEAIARDIADGLADGRFRPPSRPAMTYMMSKGQVLIGDDGQAAGNWRPHIMIYYPWLTTADVGGASIASGIVVDPGRPTSNIMVVVSDFVDPAAASP